MARWNTTGQCPADPIGSFLNPADSCSTILHDHPQATSGNSIHSVSNQILVYTGDYWLRNSPGYAVKVFCDMERVCGCGEGREGGGGWMRVADINMTRPNENCPEGFRKVTTSGKTICGGKSSRCISTTFSSHGIQYGGICGKIIGYQFGRTNAFNRYISHRGSLDTNFIDGIILTYGSPRSRIWTFTAGGNQYMTNRHGCPCNSGYSGAIPPYINGNYFCDSGYCYNNDPVPLNYYTNEKH